MSNPHIEHFCTLFDSNYLPLGMALHRSLEMHAQPFHLWILCMDEKVERQLQKLALTNVTLIPLKEVETSEILSVKSGRSKGEYCWTLTPFTFTFVFNRDQSIQKVTYLDADIYFFDDPQILLKEFAEETDVLITEHAYAPEYDQSKTSGRFCVQFLTVKRTQKAFEIIKWWQDRCLEWCFNRIEDNKFGDQKYLDSWPGLFNQSVQILSQVDKTLAPWNIDHIRKKNNGKINPVFYHFHSLKIISSTEVQLYLQYRIDSKSLELYESYIESLQDIINQLKEHQIPIPVISNPKQSFQQLRRMKRLFFQETRFRNIS
jgi:hypothetical protein